MGHLYMHSLLSFVTAPHACQSYSYPYPARWLQFKVTFASLEVADRELAGVGADVDGGVGDRSKDALYTPSASILTRNCFTTPAQSTTHRMQHVNSLAHVQPRDR